MKYMLAFVAVLAAVTVCDSSVVRASPRSNLSVGYVATGDRLLYRTYLYQPSISNTIQYEDLVWRGNVSTRISAVQATEVGGTQYASAWIIGGGLGWSNVTIRFQSYRGYGYYYIVDIWGR